MDQDDVKVDELFVPQKEISKPALLEKDFLDILKMVAPGTSLRTALDDLLRAEMGALIVVDNGNIGSVFEMGFKIHARFSPQKLVELAKMDGAIVLSRNMKKILYANALLFPSQEIQTKETGTRHKAAERTAKQTGAIVLAVSERKNKITIYCGDLKHELRPSSEILRRATENLQILEKQRESFNETINDLNLLELKRMVTINDVALVIQRFEIIKRISEVVKRYLVELGKEGAIVSMRLKDLTLGLDKEEELFLRDYFVDVGFVRGVLEKMDFDFLLEVPNISRILFEELHDRPISPKGFRILNKINILDRYVDSLIGNFKNLDSILFATEEELLEIFENEGLVSFFKEEIYNLREKIRIGKKI
jgi:diadenylate cyclase